MCPIHFFNAKLIQMYTYKYSTFDEKPEMWNIWIKCSFITLK